MKDEMKGLDIAVAFEAGRDLENAEQRILYLSREHLRLPHAVPFAVIPQDRKVVSLGEFMPGRKRFNMRFDDVESFVDFVEKFKDGRTRIWMKGNTLYCVIDWHEPDAKVPVTCDDADAVERGEQQATLQLQVPEVTREWLELFKRPLSQMDFAEFLEDHLDDIVTPEAADVLEVARTLQANRTVTYKGGVRTQNGDVTLNWVQETDARAGAAGQLEIPSEIVLRMEFWVGGAATELRVGLRYRIKEGVLTFHLRPLGLERVMRDYAKALADSIQQRTGVTVWRGVLQ